MLEVRNVVGGYGEIQILHGVNLTVHRGEVVGLLGANGVGKTTLLRVISGLIRPGGGQVLYQGQDLVGISPARLLRMGIAHVPQGRHIFSDMTVKENLLVALDRVRDRVNAGERLEYALNLFPRLRERYHQLGGTLSGGEQQMLAIARALAPKPDLLMLDEPSMGLAPVIVESVFKTIRQIAEDGTTILLVEQNATAALHVVDRVYVMETGTIVHQSERLDDSELQRIKEVYLGLSDS
ncbi:ABC transporter ATP-binding protein [Kyrpidia spormannii]|uniref:ABC transporter ATP-binding protein n=1 Tax=Kyrpidia spormannii TaxID=2055160 RepID=A0A2K8N7C5_9BACL|nr:MULTISPECIES: ABC transporter ATP-binding protein [Kyrpidia]ATY85236.1 ABC transporter ATP-binding protein [Kyrpidia spormannii]MCL6575855.1 ABC transporter ATP-binding protein [Kyrpidia sp.]